MKLKISLIFIGLAALFIFFVFKGGYLNIGSDKPSAQSKEAKLSSESVLNTIYSADLRDYTGNKFKVDNTALSSQQDVIVHLWASWCGPCVNEVPELIEFSEKHPDVKFVIVSLDEYQDDIAKFMKSFPEFNNSRYIRVWDGDNTFAKFLNADRLPMSVILKKNNNEPVVVKSVVDWKTLKL
ncbi:redoxin family protein [bacterium]|nr:redoxin family protein [bacterium]